MSDPVVAVGRIAVPTAAYGGGSAPVTLPASAALLSGIARIFATDYVSYQYSVGDNTGVDKFLSVTALDQGVSTSPAAPPRFLGEAPSGPLGSNPNVFWEIFPQT